MLQSVLFDTNEIYQIGHGFQCLDYSLRTQPACYILESLCMH